MPEDRPLYLYGLEVVGPRFHEWLFVAGLRPLQREQFVPLVAAYVWERCALPPDWSPHRQFVFSDEPLAGYDTRDETFYAVPTSEERAGAALIDTLEQQGYTVLLATPRDA